MNTPQEDIDLLIEAASKVADLPWTMNQEQFVAMRELRAALARIEGRS